MAGLKRYRTLLSDSALWTGFRFRAGDIVISPPPKCGTTWMQMLCALLVFDTEELDRPLTEISPWLDAVFDDHDAVVATLEAQQHRRFIKTHTPLDGLVFDERVTYICVGRDPRDVAVSYAHSMANLDRDTFVAALAVAGRASREVEPPPVDPVERFWHWADGDARTDQPGAGADASADTRPEATLDAKGAPYAPHSPATVGSPVRPPCRCCGPGLITTAAGGSRTDETT